MRSSFLPSSRPSVAFSSVPTPPQPDGRLWIAIVRIDAEHVSTLMAEDSVVWAEPAPGKPVFSGEMSSVIVSGALDGGQPVPGYWSWLEDVGYDGTGVMWAVVDSGVDPLHPDLAGLEGISYPGCETDLPGDDPGYRRPRHGGRQHRRRARGRWIHRSRRVPMGSRRRARRTSAEPECDL